MSAWSHAQTLTAALPFARPQVPGGHDVMLEVDIPEGGVLVLECTFLPKPAPLVIVLHGVSGSSKDSYVVRAARAFLRAGFHTARLNQRGSGLGMGKARRLAHAGLGEDLALAVRFLSQRSDVTTIGSLGFSLGGHVALSCAADVADQQERLDKLRALATISAPVDLVDSARGFDALRAGRFTGFYERRMVASLIQRARAVHESGHPVPFLPAALDAITTIRGFDELVTCPSHGFRDVDDSSPRASVAPRLHRIGLPTLMVHANDDPMVPVTALRTLHASARISSAVDVVILPTGGHVGFIEGFTQLWDATSAVHRALLHMKRHLA